MHLFWMVDQFSGDALNVTPRPDQPIKIVLEYVQYFVFYWFISSMVAVR